MRGSEIAPAPRRNATQRGVALQHQLLRADVRSARNAAVRRRFERLFCEIRKVGFTSTINQAQHFEGKPHRVKERAALEGPQRCDVCDTGAFHSKKQLDEHKQGRPHRNQVRAVAKREARLKARAALIVEHQRAREEAERLEAEEKKIREEEEAERLEKKRRRREKRARKEEEERRRAKKARKVVESEEEEE